MEDGKWRIGDKVLICSRFEYFCPPNPALAGADGTFQLMTTLITT